MTHTRHDYAERWNLPRACLCGARMQWTRGRTAHRPGCSIVRAVAATVAHFDTVKRRRTATR